MPYLQQALEAQIQALTARLTELDRQMLRADQILLEMGEAADEIMSQPGSWDGEIESIPDTDSDTETVAYYTPADAYMGEDDDSDTETVVEEWEDPFLTPERIYNIYIPRNLEEGLEGLA